jgi:uncharacterized protein YjbI with pentapeptide repeats
MTYTTEKLAEIIASHGKWWRCEDGGVRASLARANLARANLARANLEGLKWVSVGWHGHGECGRTLTGLLVGGEAKYQCGCFYGTEAELRAYIANGNRLCRIMPE